jgi:hypothetical protein
MAKVSILERETICNLKNKNKNNENCKFTACPTYSAPPPPHRPLPYTHRPTEGFSRSRNPGNPQAIPPPPQPSQLLPTYWVGGWERILTLTEWQNHKGMQRPMRPRLS